MHLCFSNKNYSLGREITQALVTRKYDYSIQKLSFNLFYYSVCPSLSRNSPPKQWANEVNLYLLQLYWVYNLLWLLWALRETMRSLKMRAVTTNTNLRSLTQVPLFIATWSVSLLVPRSLPATCYTNAGNWASVGTKVTKVGSVWCQSHPSNLTRTLNGFFF